MILGNRTKQLEKILPRIGFQIQRDWLGCMYLQTYFFRQRLERQGESQSQF